MAEFGLNPEGVLFDSGLNLNHSEGTSASILNLFFKMQVHLTLLKENFKTMREFFFHVGDELIRYNADTYRVYRFNNKNWVEVMEPETRVKIRLQGMEIPRHQAMAQTDTSCSR